MAATSPVSSSSSAESTAVQPMSIHFLSLRKVTRICKVDLKSALAALIEKIVAIYNGAHPRQRYERYVADRAEGDFRVDVYGHRASFTTKLGKWVHELGSAADLTVQRISYLIFYRREFKKGDKERREIFALTTGHAYQVIGQMADYQFPVRVVKRIAAPEVFEMRQRPLVGAVLVFSEIFKKASKLSSSEATGALLTRAEFGFRQDASLFQLGCFRTQKGKPAKRGASVEIGLGLVRFAKQLTPEDFREVLPHLSLIAWGDPTLRTPADKGRERDSEDLDYLDYLQRTDFTMIPTLERQLVKYIYAAVVKKEPFPALDFCHSRRTDYLRAVGHELRYGTQRLPCADPFSAEAMVRALRKLKPLSTCSDFEKFTAELAKVFVSFSAYGSNQQAPFTDFFEGEIRLIATGEIFWRLHKVWFILRADYLGVVCQEFSESLRKTLILSGETGALSEKWPSPKEKAASKVALKTAHKATCKDKSCTHGVKYDAEAEYNGKQANKKGYYLGDKICPQGIELFDILYYTDREIYLYHVKEGFGQKTRDACSQIVNAAKLLQTLKHEGSSNILEEFYKRAIKHKEKAVQDKYLALGLKGLKELFAKRRLVFVYAFIDDAKNVRRLSNDRDIRTRIKPDDLGKANRNFKGITREIFDGLVNQGYLAKKGYLTSKFFSTSGANFRLDVIKVQNQWKTLYDYLSSHHASQFDSTIAKMEILRTQKEIESLGFEFRIHQIVRTDYPADGSLGRRAAPPKGHADADRLSGSSDDEPDGPLEIGEGSDFQHGGVTYHIHFTEADLACGLHALLGRSRGGHYIFSEGDDAPWLAVRRRYFAQFNAQYGAFRDQISRCLVSLLEDYLGIHPSRYVPMIFDQIPRAIAALRADLAPIKAQEAATKAEQQGLFVELLNVEGDGIQEHLSQSLGVAVDELQSDQARCIERFHGNLNNVLDGIRGTDIEQRISANRQLLDDLDQQRKDLYTRFVQSARVLAAYRRACLSRDYFFSNEELTGIGSWIFGLRVTLFAHQGADQVAPSQDGPAGGPSVHIFHKGIHFSRCEVVPAAAAAAAAAAAPAADYDSDIDARHGFASAAAPAAAANDGDDDTRLGNAPAAAARPASATATASPSSPMDVSD